jgi:hypothetical protein
MSGSDSEMSMKRTLLKKGDKLKFKLESKMVKPTAMDMPASESEEDAMMAGGGGGGGGGSEPKKLGEGDEDVEVAGKKLKCHWVEYEMDSGGGKMKSKVWTSDAVPGGTVKTVSKNDTMESTMTLTGFEKK